MGSNLYENIKALRLARGWSQQQLAEIVGYGDRSSIAKIESGKVDLSRSKIADFAKAFDVTPAYLMGWSNQAKPTRYTAANVDMLTEYPDELTAAEFLVLGYELEYYKDGIYLVTDVRTSETYHISKDDFEPGEKSPQQRAIEISQKLQKGKQELQDALYRLYQKADQRDQMLVRQILSRYGDDLDCLENKKSAPDGTET